MSFKFNFFPEDDDHDDDSVVQDAVDSKDHQESERIFIQDQEFEKYKVMTAADFTCLPYRPHFNQSATTKDGDPNQKDSDDDDDEDDRGLVCYLMEEEEKADDTVSDLVPNVYEGGHKIWECSLDLCEFLADEKICFEGLSVLELGCGCGLPGLFAYVGGADSVHFQDFNKDVLTARTIPNVIVNAREPTSPADVNKMCQFWSGDWSKFTEKAIANRYSYDIILTSETIYSTANYNKLHDCLQSLLKKSGAVYLSAKSYYFGVRGGTQEFTKFVQEKNTFNIEVAKTIDAHLKREILKMTMKS